MTKLVFIEHGGNRREVEAENGKSVMVAATAAGVDGIAAECGGSCMCATCHCLVIETPNELPGMEETERDTLEFTANDMQPNSRLTCQITVGPDMAGTVFEVVGN